METTEAAWAEVAGAETENYTVVYMTRFIVELPAGATICGNVDLLAVTNIPMLGQEAILISIS